MQKFYNIFPKGRRRQLNFYSPSDAFLSVQTTPKPTYKYSQFDSDCHNSGIMSDNTNKQDSNEFVFDKENHLKTLDNNFSSLHLNLSFSVMEENNCHIEEKNKPRKNMYVIKISHSKYFHIGQKETISINEGQLTTQSCVDDKTLVDLGKLLDCEDKLTEECITLISLHLDDQWKKFVKYLGLEETSLVMLDGRNDNEKALIIYDVIQEYMNLFPNTSLGFVIYILSEIHQLAIIERLAQELNIDRK